MTLASNRYFKQDSNSGYEKEVSFFDVETWSKLAQACYDRGKKGRGVRVVGRLKQSRWNDTEGKTRYRISIVAEHVEFRPEFKKDAKSTSSPEIPMDDEFEADESDVEAMAMAMQEKELAEVAF